MSIKRVLCPARVRRIPAQFSWIDQRLVRDNVIGACGPDALALYLFLLTVADVQGLSYYSDPSVVRRLAGFDSAGLHQARVALQQVGWIAYERPLYQVLALNVPERTSDPGQLAASPALPQASALPLPVPQRTAQPVAAIQLLRRALEGRHDPL